MTDISITTDRKSVTVRPNEEEALTFLKPYSGEWDNHLIVIFEDAYGGHGFSTLHRNDIQNKYRLDDETITEIFKHIEQWK